MSDVGFEPTKRFALDLKSNPFDQTRVPMLIKQINYDDRILFLTELLRVITPYPLRDSNPRPQD